MLNEEFDIEPIEKIAEDDHLSDGEDLWLLSDESIYSDWMIYTLSNIMIMVVD